MGFWSKLGSIGASIGSALIPGGGLVKDAIKAGIGAGGAALGAASSSSANNRGEKFAGQMDLERLLMERDQQFQDQQINRAQEGRAGQSDAWRKLLSASHMMSPGSRPQLSPYSVKPRAISTQETRGGGALIEEALKRLEGGNPMAPVTQRPMSVDPRLLDSSGFEKWGGLLGAGLTGVGSMMTPGQPSLGTPSKVVPPTGEELEAWLFGGQ